MGPYAAAGAAGGEAAGEDGLAPRGIPLYDLQTGSGQIQGFCKHLQHLPVSLTLLGRRVHADYQTFAVHALKSLAGRAGADLDGDEGTLAMFRDQIV